MQKISIYSLFTSVSLSCICNGIIAGDFEYLRKIPNSLLSQTCEQAKRHSLFRNNETRLHCEILDAMVRDYEQHGGTGAFGPYGRGDDNLKYVSINPMGKPDVSLQAVLNKQTLQTQQAEYDKLLFHLEALAEQKNKKQ